MYGQGSDERTKLVVVAACGIAFGYVASLVMLFASHGFILDAHGRPIVDDFVAFWTAGHLALKGAAVSAYEPHLEHAAEVATVGHPFTGTLGWSYPPVFLFVAAGLARLPFVVAFALWCAATLATYGATIATITRRADAFLLACAAPWVLTALTPGQNGFLTASLVGLALVSLEERPALAGILLGLLSYKPQFGILFPFALAAGGYWRTFAWAAATTLAANGLAGAAFGFGTFGAFLHSLSLATQSHLTNVGLGWNKLQSVYGLSRAAELPANVAWLAQFAATAALAAAVVWSWRSSLPFALQAALLAAFATLATPYAFVYDLPVLSVAIAFLHRQRSFDRGELAMLASTVPSIFAFLWLPFPSAFFASLAVAAIAVRRAYSALPRNRISPSWVTDATSLPSSE